MNLLTRPTLVCILIIFTFSLNTYSQSANMPTVEAKLVQLYSAIIVAGNDDSTSSYADKFRNELYSLLSHNPGTLRYPFKSFTDSNICYVQTASDGRFRIYSWDTRSGGSMHFFNTIYQWTDGRHVYTKTDTLKENNAGSFCSKIYTVPVQNEVYYLAITNGIYSSSDASQSVSVFNVAGNTLVDTARLFKTKTRLLNSIHVPFDFFSVVDRPERPLQLITYDDKNKIVYIPVVNSKQQVTDRYFFYQLKNNLFEYTGVGKGKAD